MDEFDPHAEALRWFAERTPPKRRLSVDECDRVASELQRAAVELRQLVQSQIMRDVQPSGATRKHRGKRGESAE